MWSDVDKDFYWTTKLSNHLIYRLFV
jgi:hypothetical protein